MKVDLDRQDVKVITELIDKAFTESHHNRWMNRSVSLLNLRERIMKVSTTGWSSNASPSIDRRIDRLLDAAVKGET